MASQPMALQPVIFRVWSKSPRRKLDDNFPVPIDLLTPFLKKDT
jgi:hypothetical protein